MADMDNTKDCPCIICGKMVTVTKFATPSKVKCLDCKEENSKLPPEERLPQYAQWEDIHDKELRNLTCLSCGTDLEIISVIKSDQWGDTIHLQCPHCFLLMSISEQSRKHKWKQKKVEMNYYSLDGEHEEEGQEEEIEIIEHTTI